MDGFLLSYWLFFLLTGYIKHGRSGKNNKELNLKTIVGNIILWNQTKWKLFL